MKQPVSIADRFETMITCPAQIRPTDRYEMYGTPRICGRPAKHGAYCGIHNPDRWANPNIMPTNWRRQIVASLDMLARALGGR